MNLKAGMTRPVRAMLCAAMLASGGMALAAAPGHDRALNSAVRRAIDAEGPIVTPADKATIHAKCAAVGAREDTNVNFEHGALVCDNGKRVDDPETRAMAKRIGDRARAVVHRAMSRPEVVAALDGTVQRHVAEAMRKLHDKFGDDLDD